MKDYQKTARVTPDVLGLAVPEQVSVVMAEVAADMREGLLALAVGAGLQVMTAMRTPTLARWPGRWAAQQRPDRGAARP